MPVEDYEKIKKLDVDSVSGTPTIAKAQPILIKGKEIIDDFEDGDISGWSGDTSNFSAQTNTVLSGSYSGQLTSSDELNTLDSPVLNEAKLREFITEFRIEDVTGEVNDGYTIRIQNSQGVLAELSFNADGTILYTTTLTEIGSWQADTNYELRADFDWSTREVDLYLNDNLIGENLSLDDNNSEDGWDRTYHDYSTSSSGITSSVYIDEVGNGNTIGTGDVVIDFSNISGPEDIAIYDQNGNLLDYEIESLDTAAETGVLWAYNSWVRDGTTQAQIVYGNNSANTDRQNVTGTWNNTGQNARAVYHLNESSGRTLDSTSNNLDSTTTNGTTYNISGPFNGSRSFDGIDDNINFNPGGTASSTFTVISWVKADDVNSSFAVHTLEKHSDGNNFGPHMKIEGGSFQLNSQDIAQIIGGSPSSDIYYQQVGRSDGSSIELLVDNSSIGSESGSIRSTGDEFYLGSDFSGDGNFPGNISEVRFYTEKKSDSWLQADYDASPKAGPVFFSQQAAEQTLGFNGATTTATASGTGSTTSLSGSTTAQTTTASADGTGSTIFVEPDFATLSATADGSGNTISISGQTTVRTTSASADGTGVGTLDLKPNLLFGQGASASGTGGTTEFDRLSGTVDVEGQPTSGVDVNIVDKTNNILYETTTDSNGDWIVDSGDGVLYQVAYLFDDGSTYYGDAEESDTR